MMRKILLSTMLCISLFGISDEEKVVALSKYLVKTKGLSAKEARNEALATVYGKPVLKDLLYDENSEIFFGKLSSTKDNFEQDISFYMPKERAYEFYDNKDKAIVAVSHNIKDDDILIKKVDVKYKGIEYPVKIIDVPTYTLKIGGYFVGKQNTDFKATKNGIGGVINLQDILGMEQKTTTFRMDMIYRLNAKHKFYLSYYDIKNSNNKIISEDFTFDGHEYKAGADISSYFNTTIYKFVYEYSAYKTNKLDLLFRAGLHTTTIDFGMDASITLDDNSKYLYADSLNVTAPLPIVGIGLNYELSKNFNIGYNVDYFYLSFDKISGSMTDTVLALEYKYNKNIGLGIGLNGTKITVDAEDGASKLKLNHDVAGAICYVILGY